jgi:two-component system OmpR family response regulator
MTSQLKRILRSQDAPKSSDNGRNTAPEQQPPRYKRSSAKPLVLVVDDEKEYTQVIKSALESFGVDVMVAYEVMGALDCIGQSTPDLILLDIMMPEVDGLQLLKWLREHSENVDVPIHVVSAKAGQKDREAALSAGAAGFLAKPFNMEELKKMIQEYLPVPSSRIPVQ